MQKQKNSLFALGLTTIPISYGNRNLPHVFGAVFDVDEHGIATDYTPIDFDGLIVRDHPMPQFGPHKGSKAHFGACDKMMLFPITHEAGELLKEGMAEVAARAKPVYRLPIELKELHQERIGAVAAAFPSDDWDCENDSPFYYTGRVLKPYAKQERFGKAPLRPDGTTIPVEQEDTQTYHRQRHARPKAGTNCRDFVQYMLQNIAGVPLDDLVKPGMKMPRGHDTGTISYIIDALSDESDIPPPKRKGARLVDQGAGRFVYASRQGHGWITAGLNSVKHATADGRVIPLAKFLTEESEPFYDPRLNDNNLGRMVATHCR